MCPLFFELGIEAKLGEGDGGHILEKAYNAAFEVLIRETAELDPCNEDMDSVFLGYSLEDRDPDAACAAYRKALEINPDCSAALDQLQFLEKRQKRRQKRETMKASPKFNMDDEVLGREEGEDEEDTERNLGREEGEEEEEEEEEDGESFEAEEEEEDIGNDEIDLDED